MKIFSKNIFSRIKKSIYQGSLNPKDENEKIRLIFKSLILHLHPPTLNSKTIKFNHTFGLGGMAIVLICLLFITGLLLRFFYQPFPGKAYDSIVFIQNNILFGQLIRNIHYWSANFLIIISVLHLLRVFFTGAFYKRREFNWVLGIVLLLLIIASNFTGYLLPWDQLSYWAITVSTSMLDYLPLIGNDLKYILLGGSEIGSATLLIFYNFHTGILPILLILVMAFHFWRVRKAGGVVVPLDTGEDKYIPTVPNLIAKEFVVALILLAFIFVVSVIFNAPLLEKANPNVSPNPSKAPWYFMGIQEMMLHFHPLFSAIIIPALLVFLALIIPYYNYHSHETGIWFYSEKAKNIGKNAVVISATITIVYILIDEFFISNLEKIKFLPDVIIHGLIPFLILAASFKFYADFLCKKYKLNLNELVQTIFIFIFTILIVLTIIGIYFRGEGMALSMF